MADVGSSLKQSRIEIRKEEEDGSSLIPGLPYDLALNCLVRVSVASHNGMIHVSKPWRHLLLDRGSDFYKQRTRLGIEQPIVFLVPSIPSIRDRDMVTLFFEFGAILCPHKSQIFVMGSGKGDGSDDRLARRKKYFYIVDTLTRKVRRGPDLLLPTSVFACSVFGVLKDSLYVVGGIKDGVRFSDSAQWTKSVQCYDISSNAWRRSCPMPFPLMADCYSVQYGMFIVTGVSAERGDYCYLCYSDQSDSWTVYDADRFAEKLWALQEQALEEEEDAENEAREAEEKEAENEAGEAEEEDDSVTPTTSTSFLGMFNLQLTGNKYDNHGFKWKNMGDVGRLMQSQGMSKVHPISLLPRDALPSITIRDINDEELNFSAQFKIIHFIGIKTPPYKNWYDLPLLFYHVCGQFSIDYCDNMVFSFVMVCY